ncbi:DMT family transporter [Shimia ponticola]|uniref:DMT family transporter n=1 Tax=Shimia ponticola TaxID=2582893 RepID=UPI0011BE0774|nr:DMT family transporter [Shimia ponticola]
MTQTHSASANRIGAAWMVVSMTAFTINDAFMKVLGGEWPLAQSIFVRGIGVVIFMLCLAAALGHLRLRLPRRDWMLIALRGVCEVAAAFLFISAIFNMPLADATAIIQTLPLTVTLAGAVFLGEPVGWRRMTAIVIGFVGVLLIVRPGFDGFSIYSVYALLAVAVITVRELASRQLSPKCPTMLAALGSASFVMVGGGLGSLGSDWVPWTPTAAWAISGAMVTVMVAYFASVATMRLGEIGFIAPYRYSAIVVALLLGVFLFREIPDLPTIIGASLIVATGLFTLYRERRVTAE